MSGGANHSPPDQHDLSQRQSPDLQLRHIGGLNDTISRLSSLSDSTGTLESYAYLGLDTVVQRGHSQTNVDLTYISQTGEHRRRRRQIHRPRPLRQSRRSELVQHLNQHLDGSLPVRLRPQPQRPLSATTSSTPRSANSITPAARATATTISISYAVSCEASYPLPAAPALRSTPSRARRTRKPSRPMP